MPNQHRILVVQTAFLGDLLLSVPLLKRIRQKWPESQLILVCRRHLGAFFVEMKLVDEVVEVQKNNGMTYQEAREKVGVVDLVFSPHSSLRTSFWVRGLPGRPRTIGYASFLNRRIFSKTVRKNFLLPDPIRQMQLLNPEDNLLAEQIEQIQRENFYHTKKGQLPPVPQFAQMSLLQQYRQMTTRLQEIEKKFSFVFERGVILIFPGSVWATKRWSAEKFIEVGRHFAKRGYQVIVMGGPGEEPLCREVALQIPQALDLCAQTSLAESGLLLSRALLMIGNDSASIHLAATAETRTIAIFGPTVPEFGFRPWQNHAWVVQQDLLCRPCGPHGHRQCPLGTHECMKKVSAARVISLAEEILLGSGPNPRPYSL